VTIPILHGFQEKLVGEVHGAWNGGAQNVVMRLDTGGGKTVSLSSIVRAHNGCAAIIAHRQELVGQLSITLARYGVRHDIVAADKTRRAIARAHVEELGYCLLDTSSRVKVASVDTLIRADGLEAWFLQVTLWIVDEGHHLVLDNKWHAAISKFSNRAVRGLLPTATPVRADGKGLGRVNADGSKGDGVADVMVQGPPMRWLIEQGYLTDYRIICPKSDMEVLAEVGASGDWSSRQLREAAKRSHIVGDIVRCYLENARGKLGITFSTDIETAGEITAAYRLAGVRAETLTGKTDDTLRRAILRKFKAREIDQIVAVDIISEGFDLPAIEVASMGRPTQSLSLYMQQFGRTLRTMPGKGKALIIDHVANVIRHNGPPDRPRNWTLSRRGKKASATSGEIPHKVCPACAEPFERIFKHCPHCGHYEEPASRSSPAAVDGDMAEIAPDVLAAMRADVAAVDMSVPERRGELMASGLPHIPIMANVKRHAERQEGQALLRAAMADWGGVQLARGLDDSAMSRLFWFRFGVDVVTAQALGTTDAIELMGKITLDLTVNGP